MAGQTDTEERKAGPPRDLDHDDRKRDRHASPGGEHVDDRGVARVVVGIGVAPQALLLEEHAPQGLVAGPLALSGLTDSRRERFDAFLRGPDVFPRRRELGDEERAFEEVRVALRGETPEALQDRPCARSAHESFRRDRHAVAQRHDHTGKILSGEEAPVEFPDPLGGGIAPGAIHDPSGPENVVGEQVPSRPDARRRGFERRRVAVLVDVDEDHVEVSRSGLQESDGLSDAHLDPVRELEALQIPARLLCVLLAAVGVEDFPLRSHGLREECRRIADGRAQLEDPPRPDGPREHRQQSRDGGTHDRDVTDARLLLHFGDHGMTGRQKAQDVGVQLGGDERRHGL